MSGQYQYGNMQIIMAIKYYIIHVYSLYLYTHTHTHTHTHTLKPRQDSLSKIDHLEGWDREGGGEGDARGKRNGNILYMYN